MGRKDHAIHAIRRSGFQLTAQQSLRIEWAGHEYIPFNPAKTGPGIIGLITNQNDERVALFLRRCHTVFNQVQAGPEALHLRQDRERTQQKGLVLSADNDGPELDCSYQAAIQFCGKGKTGGLLRAFAQTV